MAPVLVLALSVRTSDFCGEESVDEVEAGKKAIAGAGETKEVGRLEHGLVSMCDLYNPSRSSAGGCV